MEFPEFFTPSRGTYNIYEWEDVVLRFQSGDDRSCFMDWWAKSGRILFCDSYNFSDIGNLCREDVMEMSETQIKRLSDEICCPVSSNAPLEDKKLMVWMWINAKRGE